MASGAKSPTRVIDVDPGLNATGYGVVECRPGDVRLLEAGVIRLPRSHGDNLPARLETLFDGLREVLAEFRPQAMGLEELLTAGVPFDALTFDAGLEHFLKRVSEVGERLGQSLGSLPLQSWLVAVSPRARRPSTMRLR